MKNRKYLLSVIRYLLFISFWLFTIREAILGQLGGTFAKRNIPKEYVELANFIARQPEYFRTLWVPKQPRFSPVSDLHPSFGSEFISTASAAVEFIKRFDQPEIQERLEKLAVEYIMIPSDPLGEIFLDDRHYDPKKRAEWEKYLDTVRWLKKLSSGSITVYETSKHDDHFWVTSGNILSYRMLSSGRYDVSLTTQTPTILYFSEGFHPGWRMRFVNQIILSQKTPTGLNSFLLPDKFTGDVQVFFYPDMYAELGRYISIITLVGVVVFVILRSKQIRLSL